MNEKDILQLFIDVYFNKYKIYYDSIKSENDNYFFLVKDNQKKYLAVVGKPVMVERFKGSESEEKKMRKEELLAKICYLNHYNLSL